MPALTVVLLHGFTNTGASWSGVAAQLPQNYRPLSPDIRGHGASSDRRPVSLAGVLEDLAALDAPRFALAGYSMGGRLALHAALVMPERVQRLVLIGASPGLADADDRAARRAADEALADEVEQLSIEQFATRWARTPVLAGQPPDVLASVHAQRLANTPAGLAAALRGLGTGALPSLWDRLPELEIDVELVVGERDEKFRAVAERMLGALPAGRLTVVPGAGHAVHLEAPAAVAEVIARTSR
ncbi:MAG: 2-succinyl-6-hydroxy-2,4-cyclohexadiene-1-carboxylate synthase [Solirubrobacteraceae bacterium]